MSQAKVDRYKEEKANRKKINLWHDQLIHMSQIAVTAIVMLF